MRGGAGALSSRRCALRFLALPASRGLQIRDIEEIRVRKKAKAGTSAPVDVAFAAAVDRFVDSHGSQSDAWKVRAALVHLAMCVPSPFNYWAWCCVTFVWLCVYGWGAAQASALVVLLTADSDFSQKVQRLRHSGFRVVLVRATFRVVVLCTSANPCDMPAPLSCRA